MFNVLLPGIKNATKVFLIGLILFSISSKVSAQNNCLNFDGTDDYVDLGTISTSGNFSTGFSYMAMVNFGSFNNNSRLFDFGNVAATQNIILSVNGINNSLSLTSYRNNTFPPSAGITTDNILSLNVWTQVAVTISDFGFGYIYINGEMVKSGWVYQPDDAARTKCYLGKSNTLTDGYLNASIDEVSFWSRPLSQEEIKSYSGLNLFGNENGLFAYYKFDQGIPGGTNTGTATLTDATTTAKNGALTNFALSSGKSNWITNEAGNIYSRMPNPNIPGDVEGYTPGDYNNDGYIDILGRTADKISVFKNNGDLTFTEQTDILLPGGNNYTKMDWVDYDNDNDLDIFITGPSGSEKIAKLYRNDGGNVFTEITNTSIVGTENGLTSWGDYDNDGDLDLLLTGVTSDYYPKSKIYRNNGDGTFTVQSDIWLGGFSGSSGGWGDYDNDGDLDILLAGSNGNVVLTSIYRNDGNNKFSPSGISLPGCLAGSASWGDYDSDGDLDILLVGSDFSDNKIAKVYRNMGNSTFEEQTGISLLQLNTPATKWGDFDNDGLLDILHVGFDGTNTAIRIYHNNGDNSFTENPGKIKNIISNSFCTADFNNDGKLDLASGMYVNYNFQSFIFVNTSPTANTLPSAPSGLAFTSTDTTVIFKWNHVNGDDTPANGLSYNLRIGTTPGASDIVSPAANASGKRFLTGLGNIKSDTFFVYKNPVPATFFWSVQAVDNSFAGGSFADEMISDYSVKVQASELKVSSLGGIGLSLKWKRGNGLASAVFGKKTNSGFALPQDGIVYSANTHFGSGSEIGTDKWYCIYNGMADSVDVTGLDFVSDYIFQVFDYSGGPSYFSEMLPTSQVVTKTKNYSEVANLTGIFRSAQAWGDFDNDRDLDLITTGIIDDVPVSKLYRNDGNFQFTEIVNHGITAVSDGSVAWGDYDNDGVIDLLIAGLSSGAEVTKIFHNNENGTFSELTSSSFLGVMDCAVEWVDFDNDGDLDFIISGKNTSGAYTKIYKNNKNGSFTEPTVVLPGVSAGDIACGDYNNDGNIDIIVTGGNTTALYRNDGDFKFTLLSGTGLPNLNLSTAVWVDEDNDGYLDIFLSGSQNNWNITSFIYRNNGNNTFTKRNQLLDSRQNCTAEWADLNGDRFSDVVITGGTPLNGVTPKVYFSNGNGSYTEQTNIILPAVYQCDLSAADIDNNGSMELLITGAEYDNPKFNYYARMLSFYSPTTEIVSSKPTSLKSAVVDNKNVKISWNKVSDKGLNYNISIGKSIEGSQVKPGMAFIDGLRKIAEPGNCSDSSFIIKGLTPGKYYWSVQTVDNAFRGGTPAIDSFEFDAIQAINLKAELINPPGSIKLSWDNGNGSQRIVFCKKGTQGNAAPLNNTSYYADAEYGVGSQIGISGWYCIFNGRADSTFVSGLLPGDEYLFEVMEYTGGAENQLYNQDYSGSNLGSFSAGVFSRKTTVNIDPNFTYKFVDLNADGYLDLLSSGDFVYLNNGDHSLEATAFSSMGIEGPYETSDFKLLPLKVLGCADYNNDGYFDLLTRREFQKLLPYNGSTSNFVWTPFYKTQVWLNGQNGTFIQSDSLLCPEGYTNSDISTDIDNDGDVDLLLVYQNYIQILKNQGNGKFTISGTVTTGASSSSAWNHAIEGDINNDGNIDLVVNYFDFNQVDTCRIKFYLNDGKGNFKYNNEIAVSSSSIALGDYDKDGDLDIVGAQSTFEMNAASNYIFRNDGSCNFSNQSQSDILGGYSGYVTWIDYNNDGYSDILSSGLKSNYAFAKLYRNNQNSSFTEFTDVSLTGVTDGSADFGDVDNDGDLDFLLTGRINLQGMEKNGAFYQNNIYMSAGPYAANRRPDAPLNPTTAVQAGGIQLKWDAVKTDETPEMAISYNLRYRNVDSTIWLGTPMATESGIRLVARPGNLQLNKSATLNLKEGSYIFQVQAIDGGYNAGPWSEPKTFQTKATQAFFTADTVCRGIATQFTDNSLSSDAIVKWEWDFGDTSGINTAKNPTHLYLNSGVFNVKLIITNSKAISDTIIGSVLVKASPDVAFVANDVCEGTTAIIENQTKTNGMVITGWSWDFGDSQTSVLANPKNHVYATQKSYLMKLTATADNGCVGNKSRLVNITTRPNATISLEYGVPSFCKGDSVIYSAQANSNYNYHWLRDDEYIPETTNILKVKTLSGAYKLEIRNKLTDACSATSVIKTISVKEAPPAPEIAEANNNILFCAGTQVELKVTNPSSEYTYQWMRSGVAIDQAAEASYKGPLSAGDYTVEAKTGNCGTVSQTLTLSAKPSPSKPHIYARGPIVWILACDNNTAKDYRWYFNDQLISGAKSNQYVASQKLGNYRVEISDGGECYSRSDIISIPSGNIISGIDWFTSEAISIYPNPTEGLISVNLGNMFPGTMDVEISDVLGNLVDNYRYQDSFGFTIDLSGKPDGIYFCKLFYENSVVIKKFVKQ